MRSTLIRLAALLVAAIALPAVAQVRVTVELGDGRVIKTEVQWPATTVPATVPAATPATVATTVPTTRLVWQDGTVWVAPLGAHADGGRRVVVLPATRLVATFVPASDTVYELTGDLIAPPGKTAIDVAGRNITIRPAAGVRPMVRTSTGEPELVVVRGTAEGISLVGLTVSAGGYGFNLSGRDVRVIDCSAVGTIGYPFWVGGLRESVILNARADGSLREHQLRMTAFDRVLIRGGELAGPTRGGTLVAQAGRYLWVEGITLAGGKAGVGPVKTGNNAADVARGERSEQVVIRGTTIRPWVAADGTVSESGWQVHDGAAGVTFEGNRIESLRFAPAEVWNQGVYPPPAGVAFVGNTLVGRAEFGAIRLTGAIAAGTVTTRGNTFNGRAVD